MPSAVQYGIAITPDKVRTSLQSVNGHVFVRGLRTHAVSVGIRFDQKRRIPMWDDLHGQARVRPQSRSLRPDEAAREILAPIFQQYMPCQGRLFGVFKTHSPDGFVRVVDSKLTNCKNRLRPFSKFATGQPNGGDRAAKHSGNRLVVIDFTSHQQLASAA